MYLCNRKHYHFKNNDDNMTKKIQISLLFLMLLGATFMAKGYDEKLILPSEVTFASFSDVNLLDDSDNTEGSLRGTPPDLPDPGKDPIGSGLGLLTLCAGVYLLSSKRNRKK